MAKKEKENEMGQQGAEPERLPLEEWAKREKTAPWLVEGARVARRWGAGQLLTGAEYRAAIADFSGAPTSRPRQIKN
ncbi:MAG: hypothetical protein HY859_04770 [Caulobacterales bacterium]|nr:hypothetical protein [Caulobacterales bacterium]